MAITKVNGTLLKKMIMNGAINLKNHHQEIDQLNVFPVPDGDTGTNMQMTMMAGVREMNNCESSSIIEIGKVLSRGLLMGARGNSGVILSQFFRGVYTGMKELSGNELTVKDFVNCFISGYQVAYKAVMDPVEGTILTVVRESALKVEQECEKIKNFEELFNMYLNQAKISLANTPNLLPVLKEAGVVDSGGAGFIKVIEGMILALNGKMLESNDTTSEQKSSSANTLEVDIKFGYCTEFIVDLKCPEEFQESDLRTPFSLMGDSLVLVQDENLCKVHVHTNRPGRVLEIAQKYGEFVTLKIENMRLQHSELIVEKKAKERKKIAMIAVCFGEGVKKTFEELGVDYIIDGGQTMNPPTEEFVKAIKEANADSIIIIPNNSNVILSAEQAAKLCEDQVIKVLKAKTIAQGYASLMAFDVNNDIEANFEEMSEAVRNVNSGEVTYAVRDTEIKGIRIQAGDYMGIANGEIVVSTAARLDATKSLLEKCITDESAIVTFFCGNNVDDEEVTVLEEYCTELNEDVEVEIIQGKQDIYSYIIAVE